MNKPLVSHPERRSALSTIYEIAKCHLEVLVCLQLAYASSSKNQNSAKLLTKRRRSMSRSKAHKETTGELYGVSCAAHSESLISISSQPAY